VLNALVILILVLILGGVGVGIAPQPEPLYELVPLLVGFERFEGTAFLISDDVRNVLLYPVLVNALYFFFLLLGVWVFLGLRLVLRCGGYERSCKREQGKRNQ